MPGITGMPPAAPLDDYRIHAPPDSKPRPGGEFVLYWMQVTQRAHDNFALNFAIEQADVLGLPLQVYHGLRHYYPWASDRFHTWILEGVVDLYSGFAARGINYAFWLDEGTGNFTRWPAGGRHPVAAPTTGAAHRSQASGHRTHLAQLAERAALVVTDFFPTFIVPRQIRSLRGDVSTPVIAVDSATLVPMAYHSKEYGNAHGMRPVLMKALPNYLWPVDNPTPKVQRPIDLPFDPVQPTRENIAALVARCEHRPRRGAVAHVSRRHEGGPRAAARFPRHRSSALRRPAQRSQRARRGEPLLAWAPFGNLSIQAVLLAAREAGPAYEYWQLPRRSTTPGARCPTTSATSTRSIARPI